MNHPPPTSIPSLRSSQTQFSELISEFLKGNVIKEVPLQKCYLSTIFTVPKPSGKRRLILNLKNMNTFIRTPVFKMSNHVTLKKLLPKGAWMCALDIKDAYLHVPIHPRMQKYLAFSWGGKLFFFQALPFGLTSAPYVFSRLMKYPLTILRKKGVNTLAYLDDWIIWDTSRTVLKEKIQMALDTLTSLGFIIHEEKCTLEPTQDLVWLGVRWLGHTHKMALAPEFLKKLHDMVHQMSVASQMTKRQLESVQGLIAFAAQVLPEGKLHAHRIAWLVAKINKKEINRDTPFKVPDDLPTILKWWLDKKNLLTQQDIEVRTPDLHLWTDASGTGYGCYSSAGGSVNGDWNSEEEELHINAKELLAVIVAIESNSAPEGKTIAVATDNTTTYFCIRNQGSNRSMILQELTERLFRVMRKKKIILIPSHLAGLSNVIADALSRKGPSPTEWEVPQWIFNQITQELEIHPQVDAMATPMNTKLKNFICPFNHPSAVQTDFFMADLSRWSAIYIFPPTKLLSRVLAHLRNYKGRVLLIAPVNTHQPWYSEMIRKAKKRWGPLVFVQQQLPGMEHPYTNSYSGYHAWIF